MHRTGMGPSEAARVVESVYRMFLMCEKQVPVLAARRAWCSPGEESRSAVRVWLGKRKEAWAAPHTFCKLLKTVVEPASVKPTVILEFARLFLSKCTFNCSLTSPPLQCGPCIKWMSPTHICPTRDEDIKKKKKKNGTRSEAGSAWTVRHRPSHPAGGRGEGWTKKGVCKNQATSVAAPRFVWEITIVPTKSDLQYSNVPKPPKLHALKKKKICALSYKQLKDELLQSHTETVFKPLTQANYPVSSTNIKERKL